MPRFGLPLVTILPALLCPPLARALSISSSAEAPERRQALRGAASTATPAAAAEGAAAGAGPRSEHTPTLGVETLVEFAHAKLVVAATQSGAHSTPPAPQKAVRGMIEAHEGKNVLLRTVEMSTITWYLGPFHFADGGGDARRPAGPVVTAVSQQMTAEAWARRNAIAPGAQLALVNGEAVWSVARADELVRAASLAASNAAGSGEGHATLPRPIKLGFVVPAELNMEEVD